MSSTQVTRQRVMLVRSTGFSQGMIDDIKLAYPSADFVVADDNRDSIYGSLEGLTGLVGCPRPLVTPELIKLASPTIRWIHSSGAGCEGFFFPELVESPITLTNGKIIQGPEVADHAFALLLSLTRNLCFYQSGRMPASLPRPIELWGKTAVVIGGGGGIGLLIAERAAAFGMDVVAVDSELVHMTSFIKRQFHVGQLHEALPLGDVVFMAAPATNMSRGMIDSSALNSMKKGAFFVNVSRGATVVTEHLVTALQDGWLAGAGLDVTEPEPLPENHALRTMANVVLSPHVAGPSDQNRQRSMELVKRNIGHFVRGEALLNVVDKQRQY